MITTYTTDQFRYKDGTFTLKASELNWSTGEYGLRKICSDEPGMGLVLISSKTNQECCYIVEEETDEMFILVPVKDSRGMLGSGTKVQIIKIKSWSLTYSISTLKTISSAFLLLRRAKNKLRRAEQASRAPDEPERSILPSHLFDTLRLTWGTLARSRSSPRPISYRFTTLSYLVGWNLYIAIVRGSQYQ